MALKECPTRAGRPLAQYFTLDGGDDSEEEEELLRRQSSLGSEIVSHHSINQRGSGRGTKRAQEDHQEDEKFSDSKRSRGRTSSDN